jgi:hypothetical protein
MNTSTLRQVIDTADEVRELKARTAALEESVTDFRRNILILREAIYCLSEGTLPTLSGLSVGNER